MRVAYVAPGAAGMYCGSCIHDNTLATALTELGHDVAMVPLYTPIRTDEPPAPTEKIFYGAVNVYLQQALRLFRRTPRVLDRVLDSGAMLGLASRLAGASDAGSLGPLTLSVLRGEEGRQQKELARLTEWLAEFRPDVVQLGNALLIGMAREIHRATGAPVISGLTGEDLFIDGLPEPHRAEVTAELRLRAAELAGFVAPSRFYAERMSGVLDVPLERIHVVPLGVNLRLFDASDPDAPAANDPDRTGDSPGGRESAGGPGQPVTIGYLARICPEKGLHLLVDAFIELAGRPGGEAARLEVGGWVAKRERAYLAGLEGRVKAAGLGDRAVFHGELDGPAKRALLRRIDLLSVPTTYHDPKGLFVLEALAHGVPVVQPAHGAFPELIAATGGGLLVEPGSNAALTAALLELIGDPERRRRLGERGREAVERDFNSRAMAERTAAVYRHIADRERART